MTAPAYATVDQMRAALTLAADDVIDEASLQDALDDASRHIDDLCSIHRKLHPRRFYTDGTEVRTYRIDGVGGSGLSTDIDEAQSISEVAVDWTGYETYTTIFDPARDYQLRPRVAPYDRLIVNLYRGAWRFPDYGLGVRVTGVFGYCDIADVPRPIRRATLLLAIRLWKRYAAPFGVLENSAGGPSIRVGVDADIAALLATYVKPSMVFA